MPDTAPDKPKHRRRWYQFSLKTLMVLVAVCCIGLVVRQRFVTPRLAVEPVTVRETAVVRGSFVDFKGKAVAHLTIKANRLLPSGGWIIEQAASCDAQRGRFGRYSFEYNFKPPWEHGWPPDTYKVTVSVAGKEVAGGTMIVLEAANEPNKP